MTRLTSYELVLPRWYAIWTFPHDRTTRQPKVVIDKRTGRARAVKHRRVWDVLWLNARPAHWRMRQRAVQEVIAATIAAAKVAGLDQVTDAEHLTLRLVWAADWNTPADADNMNLLVKSMRDALARGKAKTPGLRIVPDDTDDLVTTLAPYIHRPRDRGNALGAAYDGREGLFLEVYVRHRSEPLNEPTPVSGVHGHPVAPQDPSAADVAAATTLHDQAPHPKESPA